MFKKEKIGKRQRNNWDRSETFHDLSTLLARTIIAPSNQYLIFSDKNS